MEILRIKDILKAKGLTLGDLSLMLDINRVNLSKTIHGNPSIKTLSKIADALEVQVVDLFEQQNMNDVVTGHLEIKGKVYTIKCKDDLIEVMKLLEKK